MEVNLIEKGKIINNDLGSNKVSFKQNSSGFWYVNELSINCISIIDGIELMGKAIEKATSILKNKNKMERKPIK